MTCPTEIELARAVSGAGDAALAAHLDTCASCRAAWDAERALIDAARELPVALPPPARREEVRTAVLAAAGVARRRVHRRWIAPAIAAAAAAGVAGYLATSHATEPAGPPRHAHGIVRPHAGARYLVRSIGPDEVIWLGDGALDVEVEPLHPGERFRILVGGAELEVRGTAFTVAARADRLTDVAVAHGRVDLTPDTGAPASLAAGQSWHAPARGLSIEDRAAIERPESNAARELPAVAPAPSTERGSAIGSSVSPSRAVAPRPQPPRIAATARPAPEPAAPPAPAEVEPLAPQPPARAPEEAAYDDAWAAMRAGEFPRAAGSFARVVLAAPDGPLVEDASFWRAVALARGRRSLEAVAAFHDFLDGYPRAARAGEASAMLGWLLIDARAFDEAALRFEAAAGDAAPAVRRSARAGLDALARRKR